MEKTNLAGFCAFIEYLADFQSDATREADEFSEIVESWDGEEEEGEPNGA